MYPIKLEGVLKSKIWGGHHLDEYGKKSESESIGESWEVSCHENGDNIIVNGDYKGRSLCEILEVEKDHIINKKYNQFPLLVKFIDANEALSIQVHPDDAYSQKHYDSLGKTEAWYIISAEEDAEIVLGTKDVDVEQLVDELKNGDSTHLNRIKVQAGDFYYVPSGTVHGIGKGIVLLEIQQNSDITFRIYDYDRGRDLHLKEALDTIKIQNDSKKIIGIKEDNIGYTVISYIKTSKFVIEKIEIRDNYHQLSSEHVFQTYTCLEGRGEIIYQGGSIKIEKGSSILIPRDTEEYRIVGQLTLIKAYISSEDYLEA